MNHLAHFHLAGDDDALIAGALLGDYCKGPLRGELPAPVEAGVRLHRHIDAFTDAHPLTRGLRTLFAPGERRMAGIVTDMYFDHLLVRHWERFHQGSLPAFSRRVHEALMSHATVLPDAALAHVARMREHDLLCRYGDPGVIDGALAHIGARLGQADRLASASRQARRQLDELETAFLAFYPDLMRSAALSAASGTR